MKLILVTLIAILNISTCQSQDTNPALIGGYDSLYTTIKKETILPNGCGKAGKVYVKFDVNTKGKTENVQIFEGICPYADSVARKIVERLNYIPATRNGEPIQTTKFVPIYFTEEE